MTTRAWSKSKSLPRWKRAASSRGSAVWLLPCSVHAGVGRVCLALALRLAFSSIACPVCCADSDFAVRVHNPASTAASTSTSPCHPSTPSSSSQNLRRAIRTLPRAAGGLLSATVLPVRMQLLLPSHTLPLTICLYQQNLLMQNACRDNSLVH